MWLHFIGQPCSNACMGDCLLALFLDDIYIATNCKKTALTGTRIELWRAKYCRLQQLTFVFRRRWIKMDPTQW